MDWAARRDEKHLSFAILCGLYWRFEGNKSSSHRQMRTTHPNHINDSVLLFQKFGVKLSYLLGILTLCMSTADAAQGQYYYSVVIWASWRRQSPVIWLFKQFVQVISNRFSVDSTNKWPVMFESLPWHYDIMQPSDWNFGQHKYHSNLTASLVNAISNSFEK